MNIQFISYDANEKNIRVKMDAPSVMKKQLEKYLSEMDISYEEDPRTHICTFKKCTPENFLQKTQEYFLTKGDVAQENWQEFAKKMNTQIHGLQDVPKAVLNLEMFKYLGIREQVAMQHVLLDAQPNYAKLLERDFPEYYKIMLKDRERASLILNAERKIEETTQLPAIDYKLLYKNAYAESYKYLSDNKRKIFMMFKEGNLEEIKKLKLVVMDSESKPMFSEEMKALLDTFDNGGVCPLVWAHKNNKQAVLDYIYTEVQKVETDVELMKWAIRCHKGLQVIVPILYTVDIDDENDVFGRLIKTAAGWGHVDMVRNILNSLPEADLESARYKVLARAIKFGHLDVIQYVCDDPGNQLSDDQNKDILSEFMSSLRKNINNNHFHNIEIQSYMYKWCNDRKVDMQSYLREFLEYDYDDEARDYPQILAYKYFIDYSIALNIDLNTVSNNQRKTLLGCALNLENLELIKYVCAIYKSKNDPAYFSLAVKEALYFDPPYDIFVYLFNVAQQLSIDLNQPSRENPNVTILESIADHSVEQTKYLCKQYANKPELNQIIERVFKSEYKFDIKASLFLDQTIDQKLMDLYLAAVVHHLVNYCSKSGIQSVKALCEKFLDKPEILKVIIEGINRVDNVYRNYYFVRRMDYFYEAFADKPESLKIIVNTAFKHSNKAEAWSYLLAKQTVDSTLISEKLENLKINMSNINMIDILLTHANPDFITTSGLPYLAAVINSDKDEEESVAHFKVIRYLLVAGANINVTFSLSSSHISDEVKKLAKKKNSKVDIDTSGIPGFIALHLAVMNNQQVIVEELLAMGADVKIKALDITPLDIAFATNNVDMICLLLAKQNKADLEAFLQNEFLLLAADIPSAENSGSPNRMTLSALMALSTKFEINATTMIQQVLVALLNEPDPKKLIDLSIYLQDSPAFHHAVSKLSWLEQDKMINSLSAVVAGQHVLSLLQSGYCTSLQTEMLSHPYCNFDLLNNMDKLMVNIKIPIKCQVNEWIKAIKDKKDDPLYPLAAYVESYATAWTNPGVLFGKEKEPNIERFLGLFMLIHQQKNNSPALINSIDKLLLHPCTATNFHKGSFREALTEAKNRVRAVNSNTIVNRA
jgi:hypothetical protein